MLVFLLASCWFGSVLGGELYSYKFEDEIENVYAPTAMALLSNIDKAVVFGRVDIHHNWAYVTTLGDDNKAESEYHTLKEVRVINAAVAHPSPAKSGVVLVAGMARSDPDAFDSDLPFIGALKILKAADGTMEYSWLMFEVTGELNTGQQMHAIEVFPADDLNLFVAVGNVAADEPATNRGLILAAFSLDDFSPLFKMLYEPKRAYKLGSGIPKAAVRLSTDQLLVAVGSHYVARFRVSQTAVSLVWCHLIESYPFPDRDLVGIHVLGESGDETILVTGNKIIDLRSHPFVKEIDLNGEVLRDAFWDYTETDNDMDQVYTSFLDTDEGMLYLAGSHLEYRNTIALVLAWNLETNKLEGAAHFQVPDSNEGFAHFPKSVRGMVKADSGTMLFAMQAMNEFEAEAGLVTMTGIDCFRDVTQFMMKYSDTTNTSTVETENLDEIRFATNAPDFFIEPRQLSRAKVWCTDATTTTTTTSTKAPRTHGPTTTKTTTTTEEARSGGGGNNGNSSGLVVILVVVLVIAVILVGICVGYYVVRRKKDENGKQSDDLTKVASLGSKSGTAKYVRTEAEDMH